MLMLQFQFLMFLHSKEDYDAVIHTCNEFCANRLLSNDKYDFIIEENEGDMTIDG
jgi:hypothetical protein